MSLTDNILAYYKLDGNSNDSVGSNNGSDTSISYSSSYGKINQGAYLNNTSDQISFSDFNLGTGDFTISFWLNPNESTQNRSFIYMRKSNSPDVRWNIYRGTGATTKIRFNHFNGSTDVYWDSSATISNGTYYFITYVRSGNTISLYINGSLDSSQTGYSGRDFGGATYNGIGIGSSSAICYIDEIGLWSRALSSTEVSTLYNSGNGIQYPFTTTNIKTIMGLDYASVKTVNGLAKASIKSIMGLE